MAGTEEEAAAVVAGDPTLEPFFAPRGVVVVGASRDTAKLGYGLARNLVRSGYRGAVHFVNPRGGSLFEQPLLPSVAAVPDPVDLAVVLVPAPAVAEVLQHCGERGIRAAIIASGGFREMGPAGAEREAECLRVAGRFHMRLLGPNCIGTIDTHLPLDTTFLPPPGPVPGGVAFVSHSGAICAAVIDWARGQGFGLSRLVSLGNQADVNETDMLAAVAADPHTRVLTLYLEGVGDGRRFVDEASAVSRAKPVIALKVGRFQGGRRAVVSHTGALAGEERAFNAAFRRAGVLRAQSSEEMFDWARALAWSPLPPGRGVAVLTNAGGPGVTAADAVEARGLVLAELSAETRTELAAVLPAEASLHNPVDMLASASPDEYARCLAVLLGDSGVHSVMVVLPPPPMFAATDVADALLPVIQSAAKPVVVALMGEELILEAAQRLRAARIPEYRFPERAAAALAVLAQRAEYLARPPVPAPKIGGIDRAAARRILAAAGLGPGEWMPPDAAAALIGAYGIPVAPLRTARTPEQAVEAATAAGYPVAVKVDASGIAHKSDAGGVLLGLEDAAAVREAFEQVVGGIRRKQPEAAVRGVHVQAMAAAGQEVIIGAVQDPQFGALAMFGSGGVEVEGLEDVAFALAPLTVEEAEEMIAATWAGRRLAGFRHLAAADRTAALDTLLRLARLAADLPELAEVEVNPLRVLPAGEGVIALDVRVRGGPDPAPSP